MKIISSSALFFLCLVGCINGGGKDGDGDEGDDGVRQMGDFKTVTNRSDGDVEVIGDEEGDGLEAGDITVDCGNGVVADVDTSVDSDGNLVIDMAPDIGSILGCDIRIVGDGIEGVINEGDGGFVCGHGLIHLAQVSVKGNGSVHILSIETDILLLSVTGSGELTIDDMDVNQLGIDLQGSGDATLAGDTVNANLQITGNGDLRAKELTVSDTLDAELKGTGNAVITVLGTVNADVRGDGSLEIYGGAEPGNISEVGSGEVIFH